jgi:trypsin
MKSSSILITFLLEGAALAADHHAKLPEKGRSHRQFGDKRNFLRDASKPPVRSFTLTENGPDTRIVGGDQSDVGEFPYYVDLIGCGGSLIAPDIVLSAAHCGSFRGEKVIVGAYRAGSTDNNAIRVAVSDEAMHPNYIDATVENDLMLLRLAKPVIIPNPKNVVLSLNEQFSTPVTGEDLTVLGLGSTSKDEDESSFPSKLRDVVVQAVSTSTCNSPQSYNGDVIDRIMFCAGVQEGGKDSCQGDSGGPIVKRVGNQHIQVGVVSWGDGCARADKPGVYARVSSASTWIKEVVCDQWRSQDASFCGTDGGGTGGNNALPPTPAPTSPVTGDGEDDGTGADNDDNALYDDDDDDDDDNPVGDDDNALYDDDDKSPYIDDDTNPVDDGGTAPYDDDDDADDDNNPIDDDALYDDYTDNDHGNDNDDNYNIDFGDGDDFGDDGWFKENVGDLIEKGDVVHSVGNNIDFAGLLSTTILGTVVMFKALLL